MTGRLIAVRRNPAYHQAAYDVVDGVNIMRHGLVLAKGALMLAQR